MAPIAPFMPDKIHYDLTGSSVHTADWPLGSDLVDKNQEYKIASGGTGGFGNARFKTQKITGV